MTNTFDGLISEFPGLGVDRFNTKASAFLLTHCHTDHLVGLLNKSFSGQVYCSKETKSLLAANLVLKNVLNLVKALPFNVPTRISPECSGSSNFTVTLILAHHCLGASMFLVEGDGKAVLCTGDLRAEFWWTENLHNLPYLFPYLSGLKTLDNIYFDSTFAYRGEPYIEIPPNNTGVYTAICLLKLYPRDDPEIIFAFQDTVLGFELAWSFIVSYFGASLHVADPRLRRLLLVVTKFDPVYGPGLSRALKNHGRNGTFHACPGNCIGSAFAVRIKQCVNFNIMDFAGVFCPLLLDSVKADEELELVRTTQRGNKIYNLRDRTWILPNDGKELLPADIRLVFSRHSSYSETLHFLSLFSPKQVYPFVDSQASWKNGFVMSKLFGDICSGNKFDFDEIQFKKYGQYPPKEIMDRKVVTIDRWNVEDCKQEETFVKEVLKVTEAHSEKLALINIRKVVRVPVFRKDRTPHQQSFLDRRMKDFSLQKIVEGRRGASYRKFIEEQQEMYYKKHNLPQYERDFENPKYQRAFDSTLGGSSDYDTDSCSSSLDLLAMGARSLPRASLSNSVISESQPNGDWNTPSLRSNRGKKMQRSFVQSSFDSIEESLDPRKKHRSVYYNSDSRLDEQRVEKLSLQIAQNPLIWRTTPLASASCDL